MCIAQDKCLFVYKILGGEIVQEDIYINEQAVLNKALEQIAAVKAGADFDFLEYEVIVKEYRKILRQLRRITKIADRTSNELHGDNIELTDKVHIDALTGIFNRRYMEENLQRIKKSLSRSGGVLSILMLDIDYFKKYNDHYGHAAGDVCLKAIAETIAGTLLRQDDFVARYGGEEFIVVLPNTNRDGACQIAKKILDSIQKSNIPHEKSDVARHVTISIGVATGEVERNVKIDEYVKCADKALYAAKNGGRNRYTYTDFD